MRFLVAVCIAWLTAPAFAGPASGQGCYDLYAGGAKADPDLAAAYRCFTADKNWLMMALMRARGEGVPKDLEGAKEALSRWVELSETAKAALAELGANVSHPLVSLEKYEEEIPRQEDLMRVLAVILYVKCPPGLKMCGDNELGDEQFSAMRARIGPQGVRRALDASTPLDYCALFNYAYHHRLNEICVRMREPVHERMRNEFSRRNAKIMASMSPRQQALVKELVVAHKRLVSAEQALESLPIRGVEPMFSNNQYPRNNLRAEISIYLSEQFADALLQAIQEKRLPKGDPSASQAADAALAVSLANDSARLRGLYMKATERCRRDSAQFDENHTCKISPDKAERILAARPLAWAKYRDAFVRLAVDVYGAMRVDWDPAPSVRILLTQGYARFLEDKY